MRRAGALCRRGVLGAGRRAYSSLHKLFDAVPQTPASFNSSVFKIDPYSGPLPLETINGHVLDKKIRFDDLPHHYFWDGQLIGRSVTQTVEAYFEEFDADSAIEKMKKGSRWPRDEYMTKAGQVWSDAQIKESWNAIGENARNRGTWMHYNIERFLNGLPSVSTTDLPEMAMFQDFYREVIQQGIEPYRTEWRIAAPDLSLAGSVDFVGKTSTGSGDYVIIDWKRSKKLPTSLASTFNRKAKGPLSHILDCDANKYFLQLNGRPRMCVYTFFPLSFHLLLLHYQHPLTHLPTPIHMLFISIHPHTIYTQKSINSFWRNITTFPSQE